MRSNPRTCHHDDGREQRCEHTTGETHVRLEQQGAGAHRAADRPEHEIRRLVWETRPQLHHDVDGCQERSGHDEQTESDVHGVPTSSQ